MNVSGTIHLLDALRKCPSARVCQVFTSDKCYENRERNIPFKKEIL